MHQQQQRNRVWPDDEPYDTAPYPSGPQRDGRWAGADEQRRYHQANLHSGYGAYGPGESEYGSTGRQAQGGMCPYCGHSLDAQERAQWQAPAPRHEPGGQGYPARSHPRFHEAHFDGQHGHEREHHSVFAFQAGRHGGAFRENGPDVRRDESHSRHGDHGDHDYAQWRTEQIRLLDQEYGDFQQQRYSKFSEDFDTWRSNRKRDAAAPGSTSTDPSPADTSSTRKS